MTDTMKTGQTDGDLLTIVIKIEEHIGIENILTMIYEDFKTDYKITKVDLEYNGKNNFGSLVVELKGKPEENENIIYYLNRNKINNYIKGNI